MPRVLAVVGARPNFMKMAPVRAALAEAGIDAPLVHTGQHYDVLMNGQYLQSLGLEAAEHNLDVGSGSHAQQTAEIMRRFEPVLEWESPDAVLVVGDVNSTLACALVAAKKGVPVVHVEAGLRSFDRSMPEEVNRVLTDQLSSLLFTTERGARVNLLREGIDESCIRFVGNVMIDTLRHHLETAVPASATLRAAEVPPSEAGYAVLTLHRPANVDQADVLDRLLGVAAEIGGHVPVVFPLHPRTRASIERAGLLYRLDGRTVVALPPLNYPQMLGLMKEARLVLTDSGGIQEETTALGVPCLTLRENTERPVTVEEGTNTVVGRDPERILAAAREVLSGGGKAGRVPVLWDGRAAQRIAGHLKEWLDAGI